MRPRLEHDLHVVGIGKCSVDKREGQKSLRRPQYVRLLHNSHESEPARPTRFVVLHHHAIDDFAVTAEIPLQAVLGRLPAEATDEKFPTGP